MVNERAVVNAYDLIDQGRFVVGTDWAHAHPSVPEQFAFVERTSWDAFALWHLGIASSGPPDTVGHYWFAFGDFSRVHRSALAVCRERADLRGHRHLTDTCLELLARLDARAGITVGPIDEPGDEPAGRHSA